MKQTGVRPEMVDFVPRQGRPREICFAFHRAGTKVSTAGVAALR